MINIYTDGSCRDNRKNEGKGGWAFVVLESIPRQDMNIKSQGSGYLEGATNQQMEIIAVYEALKSIKEVSMPINLYSDSAYVINCLKDRWYDKWRQNGWTNSKGHPVENKEIWELMFGEIEKYNVTPFHVKRNSAKFITMVDGIAKLESRNKPPNNSDSSSKGYKQDRTNSDSLCLKSI